VWNRASQLLRTLVSLLPHKAAALLAQASTQLQLLVASGTDSSAAAGAGAAAGAPSGPSQPPLLQPGALQRLAAGALSAASAGGGSGGDEGGAIGAELCEMLSSLLLLGDPECSADASGFCGLLRCGFLAHTAGGSRSEAARVELLLALCRRDSFVQVPSI